MLLYAPELHLCDENKPICWRKIFATLPQKKNGAATKAGISESQTLRHWEVYIQHQLHVGFNILGGKNIMR